MRSIQNKSQAARQSERPKTCPSQEKNLKSPPSRATRKLNTSLQSPVSTASTITDYRQVNKTTGCLKTVTSRKRLFKLKNSKRWKSFMKSQSTSTSPKSLRALQAKIGKRTEPHPIWSLLKSLKPIKNPKSNKNNLLNTIFFETLAMKTALTTNSLWDLVFSSHTSLSPSAPKTCPTPISNLKCPKNSSNWIWLSTKITSTRPTSALSKSPSTTSVNSKSRSTPWSMTRVQSSKITICLSKTVSKPISTFCKDNKTKKSRCIGCKMTLPI